MSTHSANTPEKTVGASLLAMAVGQSTSMSLSHRYRELARSHSDFVVCESSAAPQAGQPIRDPPLQVIPRAPQGSVDKTHMPAPGMQFKLGRGG